MVLTSIGLGAPTAALAQESVGGDASAAAGDVSLKAPANPQWRREWQAGRIALLEQQPQREYDSASVIVKYKAEVTPEQKEMTKRIAGLWLEPIRKLSNSGQVEQLLLREGSVETAIAKLSAMPEVEYAEPDRIVRLDSIPNDPFFSHLWGLRNTGQVVDGTPGTVGADIRAEQAWDVEIGRSDIVIAVIDTGVDYTHPDLAANIWTNPNEIPGNGIDDDGNGFVDDWRGWDFAANDNDPMDEDYHGTHVAGTIGAVANNGIGIAGVAWHCKIMPIRFIGPLGGFISDEVQAIRYAISMGARVSNASWGGYGSSQLEFETFVYAQAHDHIIVAAAGNESIDTDVIPHYPSAYSLSNIISVAASDNQGRRASFSNYGHSSVDVAAPGQQILSTTPGGNYGYLDGTSMAAPHVSGVVGLLLSRHPATSFADIRHWILSSVRPESDWSGVVASGGILDAHAAIQTALSGPGCQGDANGNGWVTFDDLTSVLTAWGLVASESTTEGDADHNGVVNFGDVTAVLANWGRECEIPTAPEAPAAVSATVVSPTAIDVTWLDNSTNEEWFWVKVDDGRSSEESQWFQIVGQNATFARISGLNPNACYSFQVQAANSAGFSAFSNLLQACTCLPAPSNLRALSVFSNRATLAWNDNSIGEVQFQIQRWTGSGWTLQENVPANATQATVTNLTLGQTYKFRVAADAQICQSYSNEILVTITCDTGAPSAVSATATGPTSAIVRWSDNSSNEVQFRIQRLSGGVWILQENVPANATQATVTGLQPNNTYRFRVLADGPECDSVSNEAVVTTTDGCPVAPSNLRVLSVYSNRATLAWNDNSGDEQQFQIQRWTGSSWIHQENVPANGTQATVTGLTLGQSYTFRVVADGQYCDVASDSVTLTTVCDTAAPTNLRLVSVGRTWARLAWNDRSNNEVQFKIQRWNGSSWVLQENVPANAETAQIDPLSANTQYRVRVVADGPECNTFSNELDFTTSP